MEGVIGTGAVGHIPAFAYLLRQIRGEIAHNGIIAGLLQQALDPGAGPALHRLSQQTAGTAAQPSAQHPVFHITGEGQRGGLGAQRPDSIQIVRLPGGLGGIDRQLGNGGIQFPGGLFAIATGGKVLDLPLQLLGNGPSFLPSLAQFPGNVIRSAQPQLLFEHVHPPHPLYRQG